MYCKYTPNIEIRETTFAQKCNKYYIFWVYVTLIIQHAKCMRSFVWSYVTCLNLPHFYKLHVNGTTFGKKLINIKCMFLFSPETLFILEELNAILSQMYIDRHLKYPLCLSD